MKSKNTKLREGDEVIVVSGKEKGKRGNIKTIVGEKCVINDINLSTKYHVHDEKEVSTEGDIVLIPECKPISKTKSWLLLDVLKKGESI